MVPRYLSDLHRTNFPDENTKFIFKKMEFNFKSTVFISHLGRFPTHSHYFCQLSTYSTPISTSHILNHQSTFNVLNQHKTSNIFSTIIQPLTFSTINQPLTLSTNTQPLTFLSSLQTLTCSVMILLEQYLF